MKHVSLALSFVVCCWAMTASAQNSVPPTRETPAQKTWTPLPPAANAHLVLVASPPRYQVDDLPEATCIGVVISPQHILTTGTCVGQGKDAAKLLDANSLEVYAGTKIDRTSKALAVSDVMRHPEFNQLSLRGDIAVLRLAEKLPDTFRPVEFASKADTLSAPVSLAVWTMEGSQRFTANAMPIPRIGNDVCELTIRDELMEKAQTQYVDLIKSMQITPETAASTWRALSAAVPELLAPGMICAAPAEGMPCDVDYGGVLLADTNGKPQFVGILGTTQNCGTRGLPGLFSTVTAYLPWIHQAMLQGGAGSAKPELAGQREFPAAVAAARLARSGGTEGSMGSGGTPRIVGGVNAVPGFYPFQVSLILAEVAKGDEFNGFYCGGTRVGEKHILTAAHCLVSKGKSLTSGDVHVYLGHVDFRGGERIPVSRIHVHPGWNSNTLENDIAVLELERAPAAGPLVGSIDIMKAGSPYPRRARAIGWGATDFQGDHSRSLRETPMAVVDQATCDQTYRSFESKAVRTVVSEVALLMGLPRTSEDKMVRAVTDGVDARIGKNVICASSLVGSRSTCQGDSGGPLFSQSADGKALQIGIVSWGVACDTTNVSGVFTDVSKYSDWIAEVAR